MSMDPRLRKIATGYAPDPRRIIWSYGEPDWCAVLIDGMSWAGAKRRRAWLGDVPIWQQGFNGA